MVVCHNFTRQVIDLSQWKKLSQLFLKELGASGEVSLVAVGDRRIRNLNKQYRGQDRITDVLSFVSDQPGELGEVLINYQQIVRQAQRFNHSVWCEFIFITTHGLLHLLGYEDKTSSGWQEMEKISQDFVNSQGLC